MYPKIEVFAGLNLVYKAAFRQWSRAHDELVNRKSYITVDNERKKPELRLLNYPEI